MMRKVLSLIFIIILLGAGFMFFDILPVIGDPQAPASTHTSDYYIEHSVSETHAPNMVTAVIVDYRAFDTMFETTVMFLAGLGVALVLASRPEKTLRFKDRRDKRAGRKKEQEKEEKKSENSKGLPAYRTINKEVMIPLIEPVILIYGIYVLFHGEVSLGGGFQAGALFGMVYILDTMVVPEHRSLLRFKGLSALSTGGIGTFIYCLAGILTLIGGGLFLEYEKLPFPVHTGEKHALGMLIVEAGVALCVMATIITILNAILERARFDDDATA